MVILYDSNEMHIYLREKNQSLSLSLSLWEKHKYVFLPLSVPKKAKLSLSLSVIKNWIFFSFPQEEKNSGSLYLWKNVFGRLRTQWPPYISSQSIGIESSHLFTSISLSIKQQQATMQKVNQMLCLFILLVFVTTSCMVQARPNNRMDQLLDYLLEKRNALHF
jgi:hypothetical protein